MRDRGGQQHPSRRAARPPKGRGNRRLPQQTPDHPESGDDPNPTARHAATTVNNRLRGVIPLQPHTYEITFTGQADRILCAQFDDCQVTTGPGTTTLRAELPDQAALSGLVQRIAGLGLEIIHLRLLTPPVP
jgi:hypothetical protein